MEINAFWWKFKWIVCRKFWFGFMKISFVGLRSSVPSRYDAIVAPSNQNTLLLWTMNEMNSIRYTLATYRTDIRIEFLSKHFDGIRFEIMPHPMIVKRCQMPSTSNASINTELCDEFNPIEMPYSIYWWSAVPNVIGFVTFRCALVIGIGTFVHWNWIRFFVLNRGPKRNFAHLPSNRNSNNCSFRWWWWCW